MIEMERDLGDVAVLLRKILTVEGTLSVRYDYGNLVFILGPPGGMRFTGKIPLSTARRIQELLKEIIDDAETAEKELRTVGMNDAPVSMSKEDEL
jgi:hypothetical protein